MCCIIHRVKGAKEINADNLKKIIRKNPDGWGISYIDENGKLFVEKSLNMELAFEKVRSAEKADLEFLFHVRYATHGKRDYDNCHPYPIHHGVMFHNGKMELGIWNKNKSDSWHFAHKVSKFYKRNETISSIIEKKFKHIVKESRLAFMLGDGTILKYGTWHTIDDVFYSKIDWKNEYNYWYDYGYSYDRKSKIGYSNKAERVVDYDRPSTPNKNIKSSNSDSEYSRLLIEIEDCIAQGVVKESYIEALSVADLTTLNEEYPLVMATYLHMLLNGDQLLENTIEEISPITDECKLLTAGAGEK